ncbi:SUMF1/EgtB/PvdO family nonheme iron enzyme [Lewinella sp. LCG006]|uniref:SUMF1/EgtB/PvdO family nonheme iron enzyme n=1 Tax=Lewinella sp. LCG006 TaxID=3231911 RepID=UPI003460C523
MAHPVAFVQDLKDRLTKVGIIKVIRALKEKLPKGNPRYDLLLRIESEYNDLRELMLEGTISDENLRTRKAQIEKRLIELLNLLSAADFDPETRHTRIAKEQKVKKGHVLYRIPNKMQVKKEYRCLVRIAFTKEMVLSGLELDDDVEIRSEVRISDRMQVSLIDPQREPVFEIRTTSQSEQIIDTDEATEWRFFVMPLVSGEHFLELKVQIVFHIDGKDVVREKTLEESVVIVTEAPDVAEEAPFKTAVGDLNVPGDLELFTPTNEGIKSKKGLLSGALRWMALSMALLMGVTSAYAYGPKSFQEKIDWPITRYIKDSEEGYVNFLKEHKKSKHVETAVFRKAKAIERDLPSQPEKALDAMAVYLESFGGTGKYLDEAYWTMGQLSQEPDYYQQYLELKGELPKDSAAKAAVAKLEPRLWESVQMQSSVIQLDRYLRLYPSGEHRQEALLKLTDSTVWQQPATLPPGIPVDTAKVNWQNRLQAYAAELPAEDALAKQTLLARSENVVLPKVTNSAAVVNTNTDPQSTAPQEAVQETTPASTPTVAPATEQTTATPATQGQQPPCPDADKDTICDDKDNCPETPNTNQADTDRDGIGDACDECLATKGIKELKGCPKKIVEGTASAATLADIAANMVRVAGDTFTMGCQEGRDTDCFDDEKPPHEVTLSSFSISKYEVTQAQWRAVMGSDPPALYNKGCDQCPVEGVSWNDTQEFLQKLNAQTGQNYRLPTEAEWEYAARGGTKSQGYLYSGSNTIGEVAWYYENHEQGNTHGAEKTTRPVGGKKPNELGLYDMSGNVYEWCSDRYGEDYYENSPQQNPRGPEEGSYRVDRGGSWYDAPEFCRSANRNGNTPTNRYDTVGFRLARS